MKTNVDSNAKPANAPPDWSALLEDLLCPLCGYNLRGLVEPRCPECGFAFTWDELLNEQRHRHPYLFEHQPKHNIRSFWRTFWTDCRPRQFWREVSPANPVRLKRLLLYWLLANSAIVALVLAPLPALVWRHYTEIAQQRAVFRQIPGTNTFALPYPGATVFTAAQLDRLLPPPSHWQFWSTLLQQMRYRSNLLGAGAIVLLWPWLTFASLLIFQASMRRAKICQSHVVRTVIYSCDFALMLALVFLIIAPMMRGGGGWEPFAAMLFCPLVVLDRLGVAYKRYMRFDRPFLTVLASQIIVFLAVFCLLLNADGI